MLNEQLQGVYDHAKEIRQRRMLVWNRIEGEGKGEGRGAPSFTVGHICAVNNIRTPNSHLYSGSGNFINYESGIPKCPCN